MPTIEIELGRIAATIAVTDIARATAFYVDVLGMTKTFENGNPVGFVILERDDAELHVTLAKAHVATDRNVAHVLVADAAALHDHLVAHGARIVKRLRDADHGLRTFVFADPDGNRIDVGQRLVARPAPFGGGAVLYAKDVARVARFYAAVAGLRTADEQPDHVVLEAPGFQLVVLAIPARVANEISIASPPVRREGTPIKLAFLVASLAAARGAAVELGGALNPVEREWQFQAHRVCDGHDPEGNVFQLREPCRRP